MQESLLRTEQSNRSSDDDADAENEEDQQHAPDAGKTPALPNRLISLWSAVWNPQRPNVPETRRSQQPHHPPRMPNSQPCQKQGQREPPPRASRQVQSTMRPGTCSRHTLGVTRSTQRASTQARNTAKSAGWTDNVPTQVLSEQWTGAPK